jgi:hypothetical protein
VEPSYLLITGIAHNEAVCARLVLTKAHDTERCEQEAKENHVSHFWNLLVRSTQILSELRSVGNIEFPSFLKVTANLGRDEFIIFYKTR